MFKGFKKQNICLFAFIVFILLLISIGTFYQLGRPSTEFDEGVYLTTFNLVRLGFPLYTKTFFSQLPGFFVLIYPLFLLFGHSLEGARLSIFLYSLIGFLGILWLTRELGDIFIGFLGIGILYFIPVFSAATVNFQSDFISVVFSILSVGAMASFLKRNKTFWFILSVIFLIVGILVKLDVFEIPALLYMFYSVRLKKQYLRKFIYALITVVIVGLLFLLPFNIVNLIQNVAGIHLKASSNYPFVPFQLFDYVFVQKRLFLVCLIALLSIFFIRKNSVIFRLLIIWVFTTAAVLVFYRPLFTHHLIFIAVPVSLLASFGILEFTQFFLGKDVSKILAIIVLLFGIFSFTLNSLAAPRGILNNSEKFGIRIINKYTKKNDFVVSDDEILTGVSNRVPPPYLSDVSLVRIQSGNLTPNRFFSELAQYKPKLIFLWSGRLNALTGINKINNDYILLTEYDATHLVYLRKP